MDTLHAPTVPSGPTRTVITNGHTGPTGFVELQRKKDGIEAELKALGAVLDSVCRPVATHIAACRPADPVIASMGSA